MDLGAWFEEAHRIPGDPEEPDEFASFDEDGMKVWH
jgi:endogenous inhibitor of DNA gyrase (YacG/DUF329 family)